MMRVTKKSTTKKCKLVRLLLLLLLGMAVIMNLVLQCMFFRLIPDFDFIYFYPLRRHKLVAEFKLGRIRKIYKIWRRNLFDDALLLNSAKAVAFFFKVDPLPLDFIFVLFVVGVTISADCSTISVVRWSEWSKAKDSTGSFWCYSFWTVFLWQSILMTHRTEMKRTPRYWVWIDLNTIELGELKK